MKLLITGGSGFIGTNFIEAIRNEVDEVINADITEPRIMEHNKFWHRCNILDEQSLRNLFNMIQPDLVLHLAAETKMPVSPAKDFYVANTQGTLNVAKLCAEMTCVQRVIFSSSMLVHAVGKSTTLDAKFSADSDYGKSKVEGEELVLALSDKLPSFCIVRPTSIWGEWFGEPYNNFFKLVTNRKYFSIKDASATKTFGYVGNIVKQCRDLLFCSHVAMHEKIFYLGDQEPLNVESWANAISTEAGLEIPRSYPKPFFQILALVGDAASKVNISFPMTTRRLRNMTTDHVIDVTEILSITPKEPFSLDDGIKRTLKWLRCGE